MEGVIMNVSVREQIIATAIALMFIGMAFSGMSGLASMKDNINYEKIERVGEEMAMVEKHVPQAATHLGEKRVSGIEEPVVLNSNGGDTLKSLPFSDGFETYVAGLPPDTPPWSYELQNDTDQNWFEDFETSTPGENPNPAVWTTVDAGWDGTIFAEDWEDYTAGTPPQEPDWWYNLYGDAVLGAAAAPGGGPAGSTMSMALDEGAVGDDYTVISADNFGPATGYTTANIEFWVYTGPDQTNDADFNLYFYSSSGGSPAIPIIFMSAALGPGTAVLIWYFDGGYQYQEIVDDTWYQVEISYDTSARTYLISIDGGAWDGPNPFYNPAAIDIETLQMYGGDMLPADGTGYPSDHMVDSFRHYVSVAGGTEDISVVDTWSATSLDEGTQSIYLNQNNEPNMAYTVASIAPARYSDQLWVGLFVKTDTVATTHGATFYATDWMGTNVLGIRFDTGNIQYYSSGSWVTFASYADNTEYLIEMVYNDITMQYTEIYINFEVIVTNVPVGALGSGISSVRLQGTPGTASRIWMDYPYVYTQNMANAIIEVDNTTPYTGTQSLHFMERGGDTYSYFGTSIAGGVNESVGEFSFWFYTGIPQGGMEIYIWDSGGTSLITIISLGTDLGSGFHPGSLQFVDNDGSGYWIVPGPTFAPNTWNKLGIRYDCVASTFTPVWNDVDFGTYGMYHAAIDLTYIEFYGGAPDVPADFYFDDVSLYIPGPPEAHTGLTVEHWAPAGGTQGNVTALPTANQAIGTAWATPTNAYAVDSVDTYADTNAMHHSWYGYDFSTVPAGSTIDGILVTLRNADSNRAGNTVDIALSWDNGGTWTATKNVVLIRNVATDLPAGGSSDSWGHTWSLAEVQNSLRVSMYYNQADRVGNVDAVEITVYYSIPMTNPLDHNTLNWTHNGMDVDQYNIYRSDVSSGPWDATTLIDMVPVGTNTYTDMNMGEADTTYWWYVVRAENVYGEETNANAVQEPGDGSLLSFDIDTTGVPVGGWAFVSFPIDVEGNIETLLSDAGTTWNVAKWYNGQTKQWMTYRKGGTQTFSTINNQMGVWLHLTANDNALTVSQDGYYPATEVINLYTGWNMVGYPSASSQLGSLTLPAEADLVSEGQTSIPYIVDRSKDQVTMTEGNAYWVRVTGDCIWNVNT